MVDDLLAITIIAVFYTSSLEPLPLLLALLPVTLSALLVQRRVRSWWLLLPLAGATWVLVHESGLHATVAGVLLGFTVPVIRRSAGPGPGLAEHFEHRFRPLSAAVAVPVFAFLAAGVSLIGADGFGVNLTNSITLGVVVGLVVGKTVGVLGSTWLVQRFTHAQLAEGLNWWDVLGIAMLGGIGFTVSPLIGELAFGAGTGRRGQDRRTARLAAVRAPRRGRAAHPQRVYRQQQAEQERDQSVRDLRRTNDVWISVVVRDGTPVRVDADTVLCAGDDVLVLAEPDHETGAVFRAD